MRGRWDGDAACLPPRRRKHKRHPAELFNIYFSLGREARGRCKGRAGEFAAIPRLAAMATSTCRGVLGTSIPTRRSPAPSRLCGYRPMLLTGFNAWGSPPPAAAISSTSPGTVRGEGWERVALARWEGGRRPLALTEGYAIDTWPLHSY